MPSAISAVSDGSVVRHAATTASLRADHAAASGYTCTCRSRTLRLHAAARDDIRRAFDRLTYSDQSVPVPHRPPLSRHPVRVVITLSWQTGRMTTTTACLAPTTRAAPWTIQQPLAVIKSVSAV